MLVKIVENVLSKKHYTELNNTMNNDYFPWYFNSQKVEGDDNLFYYQFTHLFFNNNQINSSWFDQLKPLLKKLKVKNLIKIKANLNPISHKLIEFTKHVDCPIDPKHQSIIYYVNTNNGYTKIGNKKIKSKANTAVFFSSNYKHCGTNATNCKNRMVLNIMYKKEK